MNEKTHLAQHAEGQTADCVCAIHSKALRRARTGDTYLSMELADRSGRLGAVLFRPDPATEAIPAGTVVHVQGLVTTFRGVRRLTVDRMRTADEFDVEDLVPAGRRDASELSRAFEDLTGRVRDSRLRALLASVFEMDSFVESFAVCPGAQSHHHAHLGGLLEHTVDVGTLCEQVSRAYDRVDHDLLLACALLHDVGKVDELECGPSIGYTDAGRLLGHVVLGERRVRRAIDSLGETMPADLAMRVSHVILSHHGELEWGAPKRPAVLEALVLHHVDNLDAKVTGFLDVLGTASAVGESWTGVSNLFRRPLYAPRALEAEPVPAVEEDEQYRPTGACYNASV